MMSLSAECVWCTRTSLTRRPRSGCGSAVPTQDGNDDARSSYPVKNFNDIIDDVGMFLKNVSRNNPEHCAFLVEAAHHCFF